MGAGGGATGGLFCGGVFLAIAPRGQPQVATDARPVASEQATWGGPGIGRDDGGDGRETRDIKAPKEHDGRAQAFEKATGEALAGADLEID